MKKIFAIILTVVFVIVAAGCAVTDIDVDVNTTETPVSTDYEETTVEETTVEETTIEETTVEETTVEETTVEETTAEETTAEETTVEETTAEETTVEETTTEETTVEETTVEEPTIEETTVEETTAEETEIIVVVTDPVETESDNEGPAAQIGDVTYDTFAEAVAAVQDEETIILLRNVYDEEDVVVDRVVWFFIDGAGFGYPDVIAGEGLTRRASGSPFNPYLGVYHFE